MSEPATYEQAVRATETQEDVNVIYAVLVERGRNLDEALDAVGMLAVCLLREMDEKERERYFTFWSVRIAAVMRIE